MCTTVIEGYNFVKLIKYSYLLMCCFYPSQSFIWMNIGWVNDLGKEGGGAG